MLVRFERRASCRVWVLAAGVLWLACGGGAAWAQRPFRAMDLGVTPGSRFELSESVQLDQADNTVRARLAGVREYLADRQWEEAVGTLLEVMEGSGTKLLGVTEQRFVSVRDYCHLQLASLPPDALALYRSRVDPMARRWYEQGVNDRDRRLLLDVVEQAFASSWGDNALAALGEMALESADYAAARAYWEKVIPAQPPAGTPHTWLCVPDTELDLAAIRARLVLVSILEGSLGRAEEEVGRFAELHPDARGRFGGPEVNYAEALSSLLAESKNWPPRPSSPDWPTFAGSPLRSRTASEKVDPAEVAWRIGLRPSVPANDAIWGSAGPTRRVAEDAVRPLSYHPIVAGDLVFVNSQVEILAVDLHTGQPAWGAMRPEIYRDPFDRQVHALYNPPNNLGVPRFTMTAFDGKLYARMGSAVTGRPPEPELARETGCLVCLDVEAQGRLMWRIDPPEWELSFEGSPVTDGARVYVAMRRSDIQPQAHVACFEASSGRLLWRQFVCAAETPARGMLHESTHNLLTLHRDTLYVNTNLGAVAALSARDGRLQWVSLYPRARKGDLVKPGPHFCRDLTPCLYHRGTLLVAPADSRQIVALDAATGQILWQTGTEVEDVVHLLGVAHDQLIASGDKLYWISLKADDAGRVRHLWPDGHEKLGYGRGVLAGDCVYWPTREKIYVFDQATGRPRREISLARHDTTGGNLLIAGGYLLIAGPDQLVALRSTSAPADTEREKLAWGGTRRESRVARSEGREASGER